MDIDMSRRNKTPRPLTEAERARLEEFVDAIRYSERYSDDEFEYRHVQLPKMMLKAIPKEYHDSAKGTLKLLWEDEWRAMGMTQGEADKRHATMLTPDVSLRIQSLGWEHYEVHEPEPHILLFKRPLNYQPPQ
ncbi:CKS domain-containing protein [Trichoderma novae-zelandiae]